MRKRLLLLPLFVLFDSGYVLSQQEQMLPEQVIRQRARMGVDHGGTVHYQYIDQASEDCGNLRVTGEDGLRHVQSVVRGMPAHCQKQVGNIKVEGVRNRMTLQTSTQLESVSVGPAETLQVNQIHVEGGVIGLDIQSEADLRLR